MRTAIKTVLLFIVGVCVLLFSCKKEKDSPPEISYHHPLVQTYNASDTLTGRYYVTYGETHPGMSHDTLGYHFWHVDTIFGQIFIAINKFGGDSIMVTDTSGYNVQFPLSRNATSVTDAIYYYTPGDGRPNSLWFHPSDSSISITIHYSTSHFGDSYQ